MIIIRPNFPPGRAEIAIHHCASARSTRILTGWRCGLKVALRLLCGYSRLALFALSGSATLPRRMIVHRCSAALLWAIHEASCIRLSTVSVRTVQRSIPSREALRCTSCMTASKPGDDTACESAFPGTAFRCISHRFTFRSPAVSERASGAASSVGGIHGSMRFVTGQLEALDYN